MPAQPRDARRAYLANTVLTASPARLLTLLYDALVSDVRTAAKALEEGDWETANTKLVRAQSIVLELQGTLRVDAWDGARGLLAIYHYVYRQLVKANTAHQASLCHECVGLLEPLQAAWHQAATESHGGQPAAELAATGRPA